MLPEGIIGWDIGGAHLKAALLDRHGRVCEVLQLACPLWRGLDSLDAALTRALEQLDGARRTSVITMTGELADCFPDRATGVRYLAETLARSLGHHTVTFFAGPAGMIPACRATAHGREIASSNWLASATVVARACTQGLFMDVGSTTTDLLVVKDGSVRHRGYSDAQRLRWEELVYSGVVRTPVMAVARRAPFRGEWLLMMAEHFATMADVYRLSGDLPGDADLLETPDGAGRTREDSARRLARMVGMDLDAASTEEWQWLAQHLAAAHLQQLRCALDRQVSRGLVDDRAPVVGAGCGRFLVRRLARDVGRDYLDFADLLDVSPSLRAGAATCAPAVAVAQLALADTGTSFTTCADNTPTEPAGHGP